MVSHTKSNARRRVSRPRGASMRPGTYASGIEAASSPSRPMMLYGSSNEQPAHAAARASAATMRAMRGPVDEAFMLLRGLRRVGGAAHRAQLRAGKVALHDGEPRHHLGIGLAHQHREAAQLLRERPGLRASYALRHQRGEEALRRVRAREDAERDRVVRADREVAHAEALELRD